MTRRGELWELTMPEPRIVERGSGYWPTPTIFGNNNAPKEGTKRGAGLATAVRFPTPTASAANQSYRTEHAGGLRLDEYVVAKYPTPTATAHKGWSPGHNRADSNDRIDYTVEREASQSSKPGRLNPDWVEWLMGWPIGWTNINRKEIDESWTWATDPADVGAVQRVTHRREHRARRIKAIGNGQVPDAMVLAWLVLNRIKEIG
nr:hypothetical protein [Nitratifractor salsuginis]